VGAAFSVADYARVAVIFAPRPGAAPLEQRIADGQHSVLFGHHADYAAVTSDLPIVEPTRAFDRVSHYLMDTRLMIAWSRSLAARGELDAARHLAARLREFHKADAEEFFQACPDGPLPRAPGLERAPHATPVAKRRAISCSQRGRPAPSDPRFEGAIRMKSRSPIGPFALTCGHCHRALRMSAPNRTPAHPFDALLGASSVVSMRSHRVQFNPVQPPEGPPCQVIGTV
jgi:hypothetical protein